MLLARVLGITLCAGMLFLSGCSGKEQPPITAALDHAVKGEWAKADKPSLEAVRRTPDNINALILRALVCENLNRYDEAVENAYKAASIDSNSFAALYTLGRLYAAKSSRRSFATSGGWIRSEACAFSVPVWRVWRCFLSCPSSWWSIIL